MSRLGVSGAFVDGQFVEGDVDVVGGAVAGVGVEPGSAAAGAIAIPGLVDVQVNGFGGVDFLRSDAEGWRAAAVALAASGVTSYVATLITSPRDDVSRALAVARSILDDPPSRGARLLGVHLEGPFLAPARAGTHPIEHLRDPDLSLVQSWLSTGCVVSMTLAPELPGALELIEYLVSHGIAVSLGHSDADAGTAHAAVDRGATAVTHVFNAMSTPRARDAGLAGVALVRPELQVQMICDGVHLSDDVVRLVMGACPDRFALVSDAISAAGMEPGLYDLGTVQVEVRDGIARRADGTLAGSASSLADGLATALRLGIPLSDVVAATSTRPAAFIGAPCPALRVGDAADIVVLTPDGAIDRVLVGGTDARL